MAGKIRTIVEISIMYNVVDFFTPPKAQKLTPSYTSLFIDYCQNNILLEAA